MIPRGQFYLEDAVVVPRGVTLAGAGRELSAVYFRQRSTAQWTGINGSALFSTGDHDDSVDSNTDSFTDSWWELRDFTVYALSWHPDVIYVPPLESFKMTNVRVIANAFFAQNWPTYHPEVRE